MKVAQFSVFKEAPGSADWILVGQFTRAKDSREGSFEYSPSYVARTGAVSIDPVNLPIGAGVPPVFKTTRYGGLHDVFRDSAPDGWGRMLLQRYSDLSERASQVEYLLRSTNADRWGGLVFSTESEPPVIDIGPRGYPNFDQLIEELHAMESGDSAIYPALREQLREGSVGGARPKSTVHDSQGHPWIAKPRSRHDPVATPRLEHFALEVACDVQINAASCELRRTEKGSEVALIKRFDRQEGRRVLCLSAASALRYEYPQVTRKGELPPSYPRLASVMKSLGMPVEDRRELFDRMVFNILCGNDDDHARNHAFIYNEAEKRWRLSPAYDIVPHLGEHPEFLALYVSPTEKRITRDNILSGFGHFGFKNSNEAQHRLGEMVALYRGALQQNLDLLKSEERETLLKRFEFWAGKLGQAAPPAAGFKANDRSLGRWS